MEEHTRLRKENGKLEGKLRGHQERLETLTIDNAILTGKVSTFEAKAWAAEERLKEVEFARDVDVGEAGEEAMAKFRRSEEFFVFLKAEHDVGYATGYDTGYDTGVEEIFFNI